MSMVSLTAYIGLTNVGMVVVVDQAPLGLVNAKVRKQGFNYCF
jgi:hypothetical protein